MKEMGIFAAVIALIAIASFITHKPANETIILEGQTLDLADATPRQIDRFQRRVMSIQLSNIPHQHEMWALEMKQGAPFQDRFAAEAALRKLYKERRDAERALNAKRAKEKREQMEFVERQRKESDGHWWAWNRKLMYVGKGSSAEHPVYMMQCEAGKEPSFFEMLDIKQSSPSRLKPKNGKVKIGFLWDGIADKDDWLASTGKMLSNDSRLKVKMPYPHSYLRPAARSLLRGKMMTIATVTNSNHHLDDLITIPTPSRKVVNKFLSDCLTDAVSTPTKWRKKDQPPPKPKPIQKVHGDTDMHHFVRMGQIGKLRRHLATSPRYLVCATNNLGQTPAELAYILDHTKAYLLLAQVDGHLC